MSKIDDIINNLKELEETAIEHINCAIKQTYQSQFNRTDDEDDHLSDSKAAHKLYLLDCISKFIEHIRDVDGSFAGNNPSDADGKTDAKGKSVWWAYDFVMSQDLVDAIAKEAAQAATKTVVELMTVPSKDNIDVLYEKATEAATNAILTYLLGVDNDKLGLLDKINPDKKRAASNILYFKYIPDMLDLNDDHICKLLPYLLTAYVCSINHNSVFLRGETALAHIFGDLDHGDILELPRDARRKSQIERLSKCFSLKGITFRRQKTRKERPQPYIVNRRNPYNDVEFAAHVFELFAAITCEEPNCGNEIIQNIVNKIDLKSCYFLFLSYTCPDELYKLPDESVSSCWNDFEYNERLFQAFHNHYECRYLF